MARMNGLSPRVRGNPEPVPGGESPAGSIPASAGEPRVTCTLWPKTGVYPRECGGTSDEDAAVVQQVGLSPRVRGNPVNVRQASMCCGSIPASAGEPLGATALILQVMLKNGGDVARLPLLPLHKQYAVGVHDLLGWLAKHLNPQLAHRLDVAPDHHY